MACPDNRDCGDINQDGQVDVLDIVYIVNILLGGASATGEDLACADVNGDGSVNVQDIVILVNNVLGNYEGWGESPVDQCLREGEEEYVDICGVLNGDTSSQCNNCCSGLSFEQCCPPGTECFDQEWGSGLVIGTTSCPGSCMYDGMFCEYGNRRGGLLMQEGGTFGSDLGRYSGTTIGYTDTYNQFNDHCADEKSFLVEISNFPIAAMLSALEEYLVNNAPCVSINVPQNGDQYKPGPSKFSPNHNIAPPGQTSQSCCTLEEQGIMGCPTNQICGKDCRCHATTPSDENFGQYRSGGKTRPITRGKILQDGGTFDNNSGLPSGPNCPIGWTIAADGSCIPEGS